MKFEQMNLIRPLLRAIREVGYTDPTPIQEKTIPPVLLGKDVLGCAQTGTGKTAAFALPILQRIARAEDFDSAASARPIRALILTPTRELALQIFENFEQYGKYLPVRSAVIFGGVNQNPQVETLKKGVDILVATPGRLNDLIGQGYISLSDIRIFVLDEADRMLDMGFIHDVRKVMGKLPTVRQTLLFSATMPPQVEEIAEALLTKPVNVKISPVTSTVDSVAQSVYFLAKADKTKLLLHLLNGHGVSSALVFTRTKHGADQVARQLNKEGIKALAIHGNKSQNARQNALSQFKSGGIDVLVATDIAARGIDIVELPTVINYNVPEEPETYIHRIGRTGRAGQEGVAITFCCSDELESFRDIEKLTKRHVEERMCEWSVVDMVPTKPEPRQSRGRRQETPVKQVSKQEKKETPKQAPKQVTKQAPKQEKSAIKSTSPKQSPMQTPKQAPKPQRQSPKQAPKVESKPKVVKVAPHPERKTSPAVKVNKPVDPTADRRYADNGEHDGATGQQIVTNFNRSVWLEFNEPKKSKKKPWQTPPEKMPQEGKPALAPEKQAAEQAKTAEPIKKEKPARRWWGRKQK